MSLLSVFSPTYYVLILFDIFMIHNFIIDAYQLYIPGMKLFSVMWFIFSSSKIKFSTH